MSHIQFRRKRNYSLLGALADFVMIPGGSPAVSPTETNLVLPGSGSLPVPPNMVPSMPFTVPFTRNMTQQQINALNFGLSPQVDANGLPLTSGSNCVNWCPQGEGAVLANCPSDQDIYPPGNDLSMGNSVMTGSDMNSMLPGGALAIGNAVQDPLSSYNPTLPGAYSFETPSPAITPAVIQASVPGGIAGGLGEIDEQDSLGKSILGLVLLYLGVKLLDRYGY